MANCSSFQLHLVELLVLVTSLVYEGIGQRSDPLVLVLSLIGLGQLQLSYGSHWACTSEADLALRSLGYHSRHRLGHTGLLPHSSKHLLVHCSTRILVHLAKRCFTV